MSLGRWPTLDAGGHGVRNLVVFDFLACTFLHEESKNIPTIEVKCSIIDKTHDSQNYVSMKTNVDLDERLVERARSLTGIKTKKDVINHALSELVRRKDQKQILKLRGKVTWKGNLDEMRESRF
jgi:Arc/MetJ family transcription regulator